MVMIEYICIIKTIFGGKKILESIGYLSREELRRARIWLLGDLDLSSVAKEFEKRNIPTVLQKTEAPFIFLRENLSDTARIVFLNENIMLYPSMPKALLDILDTKLDAGFVSAKFCEFPQKYIVNDIYKPSILTEVEGKGILPIDIASPYLFVCRGKVFKEIDFAQKSLFGIGLRRLGYQNYLATEVEVGYE